MRENYTTKGRRYVAEGRVNLRLVTDAEVKAVVRGGGHAYETGFDGERWFCTCPALGECSHLAAVKLVVVVPKAGA